MCTCVCGVHRYYSVCICGTCILSVCTGGLYTCAICTGAVGQVCACVSTHACSCVEVLSVHMCDVCVLSA